MTYPRLVMLDMLLDHTLWSVCHIHDRFGVILGVKVGFEIKHRIQRDQCFDLFAVAERKLCCEITSWNNVVSDLFPLVNSGEEILSYPHSHQPEAILKGQALGFASHLPASNGLHSIHGARTKRRPCHLGLPCRRLLVAICSWEI